MHVVPAGITGVIIDDTIGRPEFIGWMREPADHYDRCSGRPSKPGKATRQANEEFGVGEPTRTLLQRSVARFILRSIGNMAPHEAMAVCRLLIDADDAVPRRL